MRHLEGLVQLHLPESDKSTTASWTEHHHGFSGSLQSLPSQAGFHLQSTEWKGAKYEIDSIDEFWNLQATFSSVARKKIAAASASDVLKLKNIFYDDCRKVKNDGGALVYEVGAAIIVAKNKSDRFIASPDVVKNLGPEKSQRRTMLVRAMRCR